MALFQEFRAGMDNLLRGPGSLVDRHLEKQARRIVVEAKAMAPHVTGKLRNSIHAKRSATGRGWEVEIEAPYGDFVVKGTKPHSIEPKNSSVLRFPTKSGTIVYTKTVNHPGTKANPFLQRAMERVIR